MVTVITRFKHYIHYFHINNIKATNIEHTCIPTICVNVHCRYITSVETSDKWHASIRIRYSPEVKPIQFSDLMCL